MESDWPIDKGRERFLTLFKQRLETLHDSVAAEISALTRIVEENAKSPLLAEDITSVFEGVLHERWPAHRLPLFHTIDSVLYNVSSHMLRPLGRLMKSVFTLTFTQTTDIRDALQHLLHVWCAKQRLHPDDGVALVTEMKSRGFLMPFMEVYLHRGVCAPPAPSSSRRGVVQPPTAVTPLVDAPLADAQMATANDTLDGLDTLGASGVPDAPGALEEPAYANAADLLQATNSLLASVSLHPRPPPPPPPPRLPYVISSPSWTPPADPRRSSASGSTRASRLGEHSQPSPIAGSRVPSECMIDDTTTTSVQGMSPGQGRTGQHDIDPLQITELFHALEASTPSTGKRDWAAAPSAYARPPLPPSPSRWSSPVSSSTSSSSSRRDREGNGRVPSFDDWRRKRPRERSSERRGRRSPSPAKRSHREDDRDREGRGRDRRDRPGGRDDRDGRNGRPRLPPPPPPPLPRVRSQDDEPWAMPPPPSVAWPSASASASAWPVPPAVTVEDDTNLWSLASLRRSGNPDRLRSLYGPVVCKTCGLHYQSAEAMAPHLTEHFAIAKLEREMYVAMSSGAAATGSTTTVPTVEREWWAAMPE